jgi:hypothetical protein
MAKILPPKGKGTPPPIEEASENLTNEPVKSTGFKKDLNFKVDPEFKIRFKSFATNKEISMLELLEKAFNYYETHHK